MVYEEKNKNLSREGDISTELKEKSSSNSYFFSVLIKIVCFDQNRTSTASAVLPQRDGEGPRSEGLFVGIHLERMNVP